MGWKSFTPSRTLNESGFSIAGLSAFDMFILVCTFGGMQPLFNILLNLSLFWPLLISFFQTVLLVIIRRKYRRHFIRDFTKYLYIKILKGGAYYDPSADRSKNL